MRDRPTYSSKRKKRIHTREKREMNTASAYQSYQTAPGGVRAAVNAAANAAARRVAANTAGGAGGIPVPIPITPMPEPVPIGPPANGGEVAWTGCREKWSTNGCGPTQFVSTNVPGQIRNPCTGEVRQIVPHAYPTPNAAPGGVRPSSHQQQQQQQEEWMLVKKVTKRAAAAAGAGGPSTGTATCSHSSAQPCQAKRCCTAKHHTVCYKPAPKRENCYIADHQEYDLAYNISAFITEFELGPFGGNAWNDFTNGKDFTADDGEVFTNKKGLSMVAKSFGVTYPPVNLDNSGQPHPNGFLDHFKRWIIRNSDYQVESCGQIYVEACMAARIFGNDGVGNFATGSNSQQPMNTAAIDTFGAAINNPKSDARTGFAAVTMTDFSSGLNAMVAFTDETIWAIYEMLRFDQEDGVAENGSRASFAAAFFMGQRNVARPHDDFARVGIAYDKNKGLTWYLDGVAVHNEPRPGYPPKHENILYMVPGESRRVDVECLRFGLGLFTMLDALPMETDRISPSQQQGLVRLTPASYSLPLRPGRDVSFVNETSPPEARLPGTGALAIVKEFKIVYRC